jgi:putative membrane protein
MHNMKWMRAGLCTALLLSARASFADGSSAPTAEAPNDQDFLVHALSINQLELVLGQMAAGRGYTAEVRAMGAKMVQKHTEFGRRLGDLAHRPAAAGAPGLSEDQRRTVARLAALSGSDFDRSFKETIDAGHVQELAMYRDEASRAADPRLRALAQSRVTTLQQTVAKAALAANAKPKDEDW